MATSVNRSEDILSTQTPRMGNALTRAIGRGILKLIGWKITGRLPNEKQIIIIGAPHTSNWDFIIAMASMLAAGLKFSWMMKKEAFIWPLGPLWKVMGGLPIDRKSKNDVTTQITHWFSETEVAWLGLTPEGTRSKVDTFRKGYLRIAYASNVPIFIIGINGPTKEVILDKIFPVTGDLIADNANIEDYFKANFIGVIPQNG